MFFSDRIMKANILSFQLRSNFSSKISLFPSPCTTAPLSRSFHQRLHKNQQIQHVEPWHSYLNNIRPAKSGSDPRVNPYFYSVNVLVTRPPGVYYLTTSDEKTRDECEIIKIVQAHCHPPHPIKDTAEHLHSDLSARYPKAAITLIFSPDITRNFQLHGLERAECKFIVPNRPSDHDKRISLPHFKLTTRWRVPTAIGSAVNSVDIILDTVERTDLTTRHLGLNPESDPDRDGGNSSNDKVTKLGEAHPTFYVHQKVIKPRAVSQPNSIEAKALKIAQSAYKTADSQYGDNRLEEVTVGIKEFTHDRKVPWAVGSIIVSRNRYERSRSTMSNASSKTGWQRLYIALGSNVGDRTFMIESACREMVDRGLNIIRTSALYETKAMYLEDQQPFINGACEVETSLSPIELLDTLKEIEVYLGRVKTIENGPRTIDLDILMYGKQVISHERLVVPHKKMLERGFVLKPLCDLVPHMIPPIPDAISTFQEELDRLSETQDGLHALTPLSSYLNPISSQTPAKPTHLMAILNLTPDSFSDGGVHSNIDPASIIPTLYSYLNQHNPITILDIGGQSTRPHAVQNSSEEELSRILPTIKLIRSDPSFQKLAISVDTYRASVAAAAIEAGADIVNDVSAGQMDPDMLPTIAELGCTCILMHMRGTPETMTKLTDYPDGIIKGVANELLERVREAEKAGIRRWRIMLDPGIGFAKTQAQNIELLRRFAELRDYEGLRGFPWVVGASRKGFIGKVTGVEQASERKWGTAATVAAAVQGGADVVRVHDVQEMGQVVKMADAIWRY